MMFYVKNGSIHKLMKSYIKTTIGLIRLESNTNSALNLYEFIEKVTGSNISYINLLKYTSAEFDSFIDVITKNALFRRDLFFACNAAARAMNVIVKCVNVPYTKQINKSMYNDILHTNTEMSTMVSTERDSLMLNLITGSLDNNLKKQSKNVFDLNLSSGPYTNVLGNNDNDASTYEAFREIKYNLLEGIDQVIPTLGFSGSGKTHTTKKVMYSLLKDLIKNKKVNSIQYKMIEVASDITHPHQLIRSGYKSNMERNNSYHISDSNFFAQKKLKYIQPIYKGEWNVISNTTKVNINEPKEGVFMKIFKDKWGYDIEQYEIDTFSYHKEFYEREKKKMVVNARYTYKRSLIAYYSDEPNNVEYRAVFTVYFLNPKHADEWSKINLVFGEEIENIKLKGIEFNRNDFTKNPIKYFGNESITIDKISPTPPAKNILNRVKNFKFYNENENKFPSNENKVPLIEIPDIKLNKYIQPPNHTFEISKGFTLNNNPEQQYKSLKNILTQPFAFEDINFKVVAAEKSIKNDKKIGTEREFNVKFNLDKTKKLYFQILKVHESHKMNPPDTKENKTESKYEIYDSRKDISELIIETDPLYSLLLRGGSINVSKSELNRKLNSIYSKYLTNSPFRPTLAHWLLIPNTDITNVENKKYKVNLTGINNLKANYEQSQSADQSSRNLKAIFGDDLKEDENNMITITVPPLVSMEVIDQSITQSTQPLNIPIYSR